MDSTNIIFKKLFADPKNEDILKAFISDILDIPLKDIKKGQEYSELKQCISINIINFNLFDCSSYHSSFSLREDTRHDRLTDKCAIHFFELKKINKSKPNTEDRKELWMQLIDAESEEEFDMLTNTNIEPIKKAVVAIKEMDADEEIREKAFQRETALRDRASAIRFSREEGIKEGLREGRKEGIAEGRIEMIRNLMETMGMDAKTAMITLKINGDEYDYYLSKL